MNHTKISWFPPSLGSPRRWLLAALVLAIAPLGAACADTDDSGISQLRQRCTEVREHVVDMRTARLGSADGPSPLAAEVGKHKDAMRLALGDAYVTRCETKGASYADCMLGATDQATMATCDEGRN